MSRCLVVGRADAKRELLSGAVEADADGVVAHEPSATLQHIQDSLYILKRLGNIHDLIKIIGVHKELFMKAKFCLLMWSVRTFEQIKCIIGILCIKIKLAYFLSAFITARRSAVG